MAELIRAFRTLGEAGRGAAIVLAAAGPVFSSGHDFADMVERDSTACGGCSPLHRAHADHPARARSRSWPRCRAWRRPRDVSSWRRAISRSQPRRRPFATPGGKGAGSARRRWSRRPRVGRKRALEMLLTGDAIDARTALGWGSSNRVVPRERLEEETPRSRARRAAAAPRRRRSAAGLLRDRRARRRGGVRARVRGHGDERPHRGRPRDDERLP